MGNLSGVGFDAVELLLRAAGESNQSLVAQLSRQPSGDVSFLRISRTSFSGSISVKLANAISGAGNDTTRHIIDSIA